MLIGEKRMAISKPKVVAAGVIGVVLLLIVGVIGVSMLRGPGSSVRQVKVDPAAQHAPPTGNVRDVPAVPAKPDSEWFPRFSSIYGLASGQALKRVPRPFVSERMEYYRARMGAGQVQAIPE